MSGFNKLVISANGKTLRIGQRSLKFGGEFIHSHAISPKSFYQ
jgi:hypothetical protein